jgi:hypothetical protein
MCFNKDSVNLSFICYFTIKLANGTNEYFLTTYYILWQKHTKEHNHKDIEEEHEDKHEDEHKDVVEEAVPLAKQKCRVFY